MPLSACVFCFQKSKKNKKSILHYPRFGRTQKRSFVLAHAAEVKLYSQSQANCRSQIPPTLADGRANTPPSMHGSWVQLATGSAGHHQEYPPTPNKDLLLVLLSKEVFCHCCLKLLPCALPPVSKVRKDNLVPDAI